MDQWHIQPSEFDKMPYYRIEYMEEDLKEFIDAKNKGKSNNEDYSYQSSAMMKDIRSQQTSMMRNLPKMPSMASFKMPKL